MANNRTELIKQLGLLQKNMHVEKNKKQGQGHYEFRNAEGILKVAKEFMPEGYAIIIKSRFKTLFGQPTICSTAIFTNGEISESCPFMVPIPSKLGSMSPPQIYGACSSYAKKYALCDLLAVDDDKGEIDSGNHKYEPPTPQPNPPKQKGDDKITEQWDKIKTKCSNYGISKETIRGFISHNFFGAKGTELTLTQLKDLYKKLDELKPKNNGQKSTQKSNQGEPSQKESEPQENDSDDSSGEDIIDVVQNKLKIMIGKSPKGEKYKTNIWNYYGYVPGVELEKWEESHLCELLVELDKIIKDPMLITTSPILKESK